MKIAPFLIAFFSLIHGAQAEDAGRSAQHERDVAQSLEKAMNVPLHETLNFLKNEITTQELLDLSTKKFASRAEKDQAIEALDKKLSQFNDEALETAIIVTKYLHLKKEKYNQENSRAYSGNDHAKILEFIEKLDAFLGRVDSKGMITQEGIFSVILLHTQGLREVLSHAKNKKMATTGQQLDSKLKNDAFYSEEDLAYLKQHAAHFDRAYDQLQAAYGSLVVPFDKLDKDLTVESQEKASMQKSPTAAVIPKK